MTIEMNEKKLKAKIDYYCKAGDFTVAERFADKYAQSVGLNKDELLAEIRAKKKR